MEFAPFDSREYPTVSVTAGYGEWAKIYEETVRDEMDLRLFDRIRSVEWARAGRAIDLAAGTGRVGAWLRARGVSSIHGLDLTPEMLERARERRVYDDLRQADLRDTSLEAQTYDLATMSLADEHLPELDPMYQEAARLLAPGGRFVIVGYHPCFLMVVGMPTHFHRPSGEAVAIETHVHLHSDHVRAGHAAQLQLVEMHEGLVYDEYVAAKPNWKKYRGMPVSFAMVWRRPAADGPEP